MARRDREINIFNIAFLDVITGAMGAFVLLVVILAPYYTGLKPALAKDAAGRAVFRRQGPEKRSAGAAIRAARQSAGAKSVNRAQDDLAKAKQQLDALKQQLDN